MKTMTNLTAKQAIQAALDGKELEFKRTPALLQDKPDLWYGTSKYFNDVHQLAWAIDVLEDYFEATGATKYEWRIKDANI